MQTPPGLFSALDFGLFDSIFSRRSRRFGLGMSMKDGTLQYSSQYEPVPRQVGPAVFQLDEAALKQLDGFFRVVFFKVNAA